MAYLIPALVTYKHYEWPVIFLDIIVDENGYPRVELFTHEKEVLDTLPTSQTQQTGNNPLKDLEVKAVQREVHGVYIPIRNFDSLILIGSLEFGAFRGNRL